MMINKIIVFTIVFVLGEILLNITWYSYLKKYFNKSVDVQENSENETTKVMDKKFMFLNISTFKGIMERFVLTVCLISNFPPILIVFGTLKLGTRITESRAIKNDYFLIGNLSSIIIAVAYYHTFKQICIFENFA